MITKHITYTDFDGNERKEKLYFNLTRMELMEVAVSLPDGVADEIGDEKTEVTEVAARGILSRLGPKGVMDFIKNLVLKAYGVKHADGRRFEKSEKLSQEFAQTLAFDELMMELLTDDVAAANFMNQLIASGSGEVKPALAKND